MRIGYCFVAGVFLTLALGSDATPVLSADEGRRAEKPSVPAKEEQQTRPQADDPETAALAKAAQNPIGNLISLPFQNNTSFGIGEFDRNQNALLIQPVIPTRMGSWNLINRFIAPVISQPDITTEMGGASGFGDLTGQFFFNPNPASSTMVGFGPILGFPTATDDTLGTGKWTAGPGAVLVLTRGKWVLGTVAWNLWSYAGDSDRTDVNAFSLQYFINYNLSKGWYLTTAPLITANWESSSGNKWLVPVGGGVGKILAIGKQKNNVQAQVFWVPIHPDQTDGPDWQFRFQWVLLFPK